MVSVKGNYIAQFKQIIYLCIHFKFLSCNSAGRSPAVFPKKSRSGDGDDEEDLTRDMDDPQPEPNITEVSKTQPSNSTSSPATPSAKRDNELLPIKVK